MKRKEFIKQCGFACLGASLGGLLLESCVAGSVAGKIVDTDIVVSLDNFFDKEKKTYKDSIILENEMLRFPIYVVRISETEYSAVLMQCTHQGAELQAFGDTLECPAHGSIFSGRGVVKGGPAVKNLHSFPVKINENKLKISLKNV